MRIFRFPTSQKSVASAIICSAVIIGGAATTAKPLLAIRLFDAKDRVRTFHPHPQLQIAAKEWTYALPSQLEVKGDVVIYDQRSKRRYKATKAQLQTEGLTIERQLDAGSLFTGEGAHTALSHALQADGITQKWRVKWEVGVGSLSCDGTSTYDRASGVVQNSSYCSEWDYVKPSQTFQRYTGVTDQMIVTAAQKVPVAGSTDAGFENLVAEGASVTKSFQ